MIRPSYLFFFSTPIVSLTSCESSVRCISMAFILLNSGETFTQRKAQCRRGCSKIFSHLTAENENHNTSCKANEHTCVRKFKQTNKQTNKNHLFLTQKFGFEGFFPKEIIRYSQKVRTRMSTRRLAHTEKILKTFRVSHTG